MVQIFINYVVTFATELLIPIMVVCFGAGIVLRSLIFFTVKRELWFIREFEKRLDVFLGSHQERKHLTFYNALKKLLEQTYYECFEFRKKFQRRKPDHIMTLGDRLFLIQDGTARLIRDLLRHARFLRKGEYPPKMQEISRDVFGNNPAYNRIFGIIPGAVANEFLNILPGIFIVGGIFGTFLGIMKALPELGHMDLSDMEMTKQIMDNFLTKISYSMSTSIMGIILSVSMTLVNTLMSPENCFFHVINRISTALELLWNRCDDNNVVAPGTSIEFREPKDPLEAAAHDAVQEQLAKHGLSLDDFFDGQKSQFAREGTNDNLAERVDQDHDDDSGSHVA